MGLGPRQVLRGDGNHRSAKKETQEDKYKLLFKFKFPNIWLISTCSYFCLSVGSGFRAGSHFENMQIDLDEIAFWTGHSFVEETLTLGCDHRGRRQPSCLPKTDFSMGLQEYTRALHPQPGKKAKQQTGTSRWWMGDFMLMRGHFLFLGMSQHPSAAEVWLQAPAVRWSCLEGLFSGA